MEIERGRREATADMSEDLSEGEKGDAAGADLSTHGDGSSRAGRMARISSIDAIDAWANQHKDKKLYIVLIRYESITISRANFMIFNTVGKLNKVKEIETETKAYKRK